MDVLRGACLCGAVRFEADLPTLFCCHCHCHWCQRAHGAAFVTWSGVRKDAFRSLGAEPVWFRTSERSERGNCGTCGTRLFYRSSVSADQIHIATACIREGLDKTPTVHIFVEQKVPWLAITDGLRQIEGSHPALARYAGDPGATSGTAP